MVPFTVPLQVPQHRIFWQKVPIFIICMYGPQYGRVPVIMQLSIFQRVLYIDVPSIMPTASIMLILAIGNVMNIGFEKAFAMQNSLNMNYSEIISTYVYKVGLAMGITDFSLSTAVGMFNSVINFVLLLTANWGSKKLSGSGIF